MNKLYLKVAPLLLSALSFSLFAEESTSNDDAGFLIGGGVFSAANSDCTYCDYSGQAIEIGYDFNNVIGIEFKHGKGENDNDTDLTINYLGLNIGHDFNTDWFRLYGKIGFANINEEKTWQGYCGYSYCYEPYTESYKNSGATFGIGTRFTFSGKASGLYLKLESLAVGFENESVGAAFLLGLGYRF